LKCKLVKLSSQRLKVLITRAEKFCILASKLRRNVVEPGQVNCYRTPAPGVRAHARDITCRTPRPASVRRSPRRGPLPLACTALLPLPALAACFPPRRPTSGRAAVLAGARAHRRRITAHATPVPPRPSPWCARKPPTASELAYISVSPSFARGNAAPPSRHCRHRCSR
jgi:hypothetical protein